MISKLACADYNRRGLDESLEAYAKRIGFKPDQARPAWRVGGLVALRVEPKRWGGIEPDDLYTLVTAGLCRIAPGVAVPTNAVTWSDEP